MEHKSEYGTRFPVGYHEFCRKAAFNYQLNRYFSMGQARLEDMWEVGAKVGSIEDWKSEMLGQAEVAEAEGRHLNAAIYYRAAEFFLLRDDPEKQRLYDKFSIMFKEATKDDPMERTEVPYADGFLPVMNVPARGMEELGTIVIHGGNDSFMEEFYPLVRSFADRGYCVVAFEGPGQGGALKTYGLVLDQEWEKPTGAVLDYFGLRDVTLIGISMGGWLSLRAAAFDSRISRVIPWSVSYDVLKYTNGFGEWAARLVFRKFRNFVNNSTMKKAKRDIEYSWFLHNLMYITGRRTPVEAFDALFRFSAENLHSSEVTQDVLILTGRDDHLVPYKMHDMQVKALVNARSVAARVFTSEEHAGSHCQMGNIGLAVEVISRWIQEKSHAESLQ